VVPVLGVYWSRRPLGGDKGQVKEIMAHLKQFQYHVICQQADVGLGNVGDKGHTTRFGGHQLANVGNFTVGGKANEVAGEAETPGATGLTGEVGPVIMAAEGNMLRPGPHSRVRKLVGYHVNGHV